MDAGWPASYYGGVKVRGGTTVSEVGYLLLLELSRDVTGTLDVQQVLDRSFAALHRLIDFGGGSIQLVEEGHLVLAATEPPATSDALTVRIPVGEGVSGRIAATGEPIYLPDILGDARVHPGGLAKATSPGVRSWFGVPLILHGEPIGVLQIDSPVVGAFPPETRALTLAFVPTIAAAVQNALVYEREVRATNELRETERLKSDFLAVVSHELRTPLTSLTGFGEVLEGRAEALDRTMIAEFGRRIQRASRRLTRLIEDLLDMSRIERGVLKVEIAPVDIEQVARDAALDADDEDHPILLEVEPGLPRALADAHRLAQVLGNLLSNARKFSPAGSPITLRLRVDGLWVALTVEDRGRGIPFDGLKRVFEPFFQAEPATTRGTGGLGVGLYLVKQLCDRMGAEVSVASEVGKGSTFTVRVAAAAVPVRA